MSETIFANTTKTFAQRQFEKYDSDGNGLLDLSEFKQILMDQGIVLSHQGIEVAMRELDKDGNKKISYTEYLEVTLTPTLTLHPQPSTFTLTLITLTLTLTLPVVETK